MRISNVAGRLALETDGGYVDVARASGGQFAADPQDAFDEWDRLRDWAANLAPGADLARLEGPLGPPSPRPRQVFGIGLNYGDHAAETGVTAPDFPPTFTKFHSALTGPYECVALPSSMVDWEVEVVAVVARRAEKVDSSVAWSYIAGLTVGQDLSDRELQLIGPAPQFSMGKSYPGFGPTGPVLVTPDAFDDPGDLELGCSLNGVEMQRDRTTSMFFSIPELLERLSGVCTLYPGDVIFTGTPGGVGVARKPPLFLKPGDVLESYVEGIGAIRQTMLGAGAADAESSALQVDARPHE
jgi:2,4-didehydro-3-deoxy-L-rhamnonate hydrolase